MVNFEYLYSKRINPKYNDSILYFDKYGYKISTIAIDKK